MKIKHPDEYRNLIVKRSWVEYKEGNQEYEELEGEIKFLLDCFECTKETSDDNELIDRIKNYMNAMAKGNVVKILKRKGIF